MTTKTTVQSKNKFGLIIGVAAALLIMYFIGAYNGLVRMSAEIDGKWAQVDVNLQRRYDLIPNLVEVVKGYAKHEEEVFTQIADARAKLAGGSKMDMAQTNQANAQLEGALGRLLAIAENYPELKANENFIKLQDELAGTENRLATSRKDYNDTVKIYNAKIKTIPTNFVAAMMGFTSRDYFAITQAASENVKVNFTN